MKLVDLNPVFLDAGGEGIMTADRKPVERRVGVGIDFDCPCGECGIRCYIPFENPLDGSEAPSSGPKWERTGDTFETLTLKPSILRTRDKGGCGWHGFVTNGEVTGRVEK